VIFLSAASDAGQKIRGLDLGAVDYVTKPFDAAELLARVRAALRTKRLLDMLATRAHIDGLTGLWNRTRFDQELLAQVKLGKRHHHAVGCLMLDVDRFKQCNDSYGHPFGDHVLQTVGQLLSQLCRSGDVACRYGGEEFAIIAPHTDLADAASLAERIRARLAETDFPHREQVVHVTASVGVGAVHPVGDTKKAAADLLAIADQNLYQAKAAGRDRVVAGDQGQVLTRLTG
jgi:two-component system, cell cycle response regulator